MPAPRKKTSKPSRTGMKAQVDAYIDRHPAAVQKRLRQMRSAVRSVVPGAVEHFSYGVPGFRLDDRPLVWYAAFKAHTSLFPMTATIRKKHAVALEGLQTSTGTVRFPLAKPLPVPLLKRLVRERVAEVRVMRPPK